MAALSGYFEDAKKKADRASGVSPYSMPSGGDAGSAPAGGARPASASAPTAAPTKGSGSGFVNFGSYFGANAPAIQAQAEKSVEQAKGPSTQPTTPPTKAKDDASQIADVSKQFEGLNPAAQTGAMGAGTSLFDQMLGGGVTQRAAQAEQQRLGALRQSLEQEQAPMLSDAEADKKQRQAEEADTRARLDQQYDARAQAQAAEQKARDLYVLSPAAQTRPWESLSEQEKEQYRRVYATAR